MIKYCEFRNHFPFDWNAFLMQKSYTYKELVDASLLAKSWVTCACGNQCAIIPRSRDGVPIDDTLMKLGKDFLIYITKMKCACNEEIVMEWQNTARRCLKDIERRSAELIEKIKKPTPLLSVVAEKEVSYHYHDNEEQQ